MPDYNLGRAHGKIEIDVDRQKLRRAEGAMDGLTAKTHDVAEGFEQAEKSTNKWERATRRAYGTTEKEAQALKNLSKLTKAAALAAEDRKKEEKELQKILKDEKATEADVEKQIKKTNQARGEALRLSKERRAAERAMHKDMERLTSKLGEDITPQVKPDTRQAKKDFKELRDHSIDIDRHLTRALTTGGRIGKSIGGKAILGGAAYGGVGALGGLAGLVGSGATGAGSIGIFQIAAAIADMSGALGVLPGVAGAAAVAIGTVQVATNRFADAMGALGTDDFAKKIKDMAPAAQYVAVEINTLLPVFKNFQSSLEQALFEPLEGTATKLTQTFLPAVQGTMTQVANIIGSTGASLADWLMQPEQQRDIQTFLQNVQIGIQNVVGAAQPLLQAFTDIMTVSSEFLPQIGDEISAAAKEFGDWIRTMRGNGELAAWIKDGIDQLKLFAGGLKNFALGLTYIGRIANEFGSGFIHMFKQVSDTFLEWTQSAEGQNSITQFFQSTSEAAKALMPILKIVGNLLFGTIGTGLATLGKEIAPGLTFFFNALNVGFHNLMQALITSAPEINGFLTTLGILFADIIKQVGPYLPAFLKSITELFYNLGLAVGPALAYLTQGVTAILNLFNKQFTGLVDAIKAGLDEGDWSKLQDFIVETFKPLIGLAISTMKGAIQEHLPEIVDAGMTIFNAIKDPIFDAIAEQVPEWGAKIVKDLALGMVGAIPIIGPAAKKVLEAVSDWFPHSPAKKGPFSGQGWTLYRGKAIMEGLADGMLAGGKTASDAAGQAIGVTSAGMDGGIGALVGDLTELSGFGQSLLKFVQGISEIVFSTIKLATTDFKTGKSTITQRWVRNVSDEDLQKRRQDASYKDSLKGTNDTGPSGDVPQDLTQFMQMTDPSNKGKGVPLIQNADGTWTSPNAAWAALIKRESGGRNVRQGIIDSNSGGNEAEGLFQITPETWRANGGSEFASSPLNATPQQQAIIAARIFNANPTGSDWGADLPGRERSKDLAEGLHEVAKQQTQGVVKGIKRQMGASYGLPQGTDTGGYGTGNSKVFPAWVMALADAFNLKPSTYAGHQESDRNEPGYAPNPNHENRGIDWVGTTADMQRFAEYMSKIADVEQVIFRNTKTGQDTEAVAGQNRPGYFSSDLPGHADHVHTRQSTAIQLPNGQMLFPLVGGAAGQPGATNGINPMSGGTDPKILEQIEQINTNTASSAITDDKMLQEYLGQNPVLKDLITAAQDPTSSDEQVQQALGGLQSAIDAQNKMDTPASRYLADQLGGVQNKVATDRGFGPAQNPVDVASGIASGAMGLVGDVFKIIDGVMKSVDSAQNISSTLVRGIANTEDIYNIVDNIQTFIELAGTIAQTVTDGLNFASSIASIANSAGPMGGQAAGGLQAAAAISGIITSVIQSINAGIDLAQEAYRIGSKYIGKFLSYLVGAGQGSLLGDVKFLLDKNDWTLKTWSEDNPEDKRSRSVPNWLRDEQSVAAQGGKIRDLNMYIGPGTDPNEAMNEGMWRVMTDQGGVFTSEF